MVQAPGAIEVIGQEAGRAANVSKGVTTPCDGSLK
jgi:hypothetical protein